MDDGLSPKISLIIRELRESDIDLIVASFKAANWEKPRSTFELYLKEQRDGKRLLLLAFDGTQFAGYATLKWHSQYRPFQEGEIPEIMDLNVLPPYRRKGIGSALLDRAEEAAREKSPIVGIGVGLYRDYGAAQRLYVKRGYIPDGHGITYNYRFIEPGTDVLLDDDLILWFTKELAE